LAERNEEKVASMMRYMSVMFRRIAAIIFAIGMGMMPFLKFLAPEIPSLPLAYPIYILYVISTVSGYLFAYKTTLCSADQKIYIYTRNHYAFVLPMNLLQGMVLYFWRSYVWYILIQFVFTVAEGISLSAVMNRKYPLLVRKNVPAPDDGTKHKVWKDVRFVAVGKVGKQVISSTDSIVITRFVGLVSNGIYGNYTLITSAVSTILDQILWAANASVGNLVAKEDKEKQLEIFWQLFFVQVSLYTLATACVYNIIQPFIAYWIGSAYWLDTCTLLCIVVSFYIRGCRVVLSTFRNAYGLFESDAAKACAEAVLNLGVSIVLALQFGVRGVVLGTIISSLLIGVWVEVYNLNQNMHLGLKRFFAKWMLYVLVGGVSLALSSYLCSKLSMHWYIRIPGAGAISVGVFFVIWMAVFGRSREFRGIFEMVKGRLIKHV
jgi:O-antigen/teichoic acid export membrane protein